MLRLLATEPGGGRAAAAHSTILSKSLRLARRAGEKTTISTPKLKAKQAQKIAMLRQSGRVRSAGGWVALVRDECRTQRSCRSDAVC